MLRNCNKYLLLLTCLVVFKLILYSDIFYFYIDNLIFLDDFFELIIFFNSQYQKDYFLHDFLLNNQFGLQNTIAEHNCFSCKSFFLRVSNNIVKWVYPEQFFFETNKDSSFLYFNTYLTIKNRSVVPVIIFIL